MSVLQEFADCYPVQKKTQEGKFRRVVRQWLTRLEQDPTARVSPIDARVLIQPDQAYVGIFSLLLGASVSRSLVDVCCLSPSCLPHPRTHPLTCNTLCETSTRSSFHFTTGACVAPYC